MRVSDQIRGLVRAEILGAFPESFLNAAAAVGIVLWNLESGGENRVSFSCWEGNLQELEALAGRCGCELCPVDRRGGSRIRGFLKRRVILLGGAVLAALLLLVSSLFVWSVEVHGAEKIGRGEILRALEDAGLGVGSFWPGFSTELLRSKALQKLPELGWMSVNISGSRAIVLVREREGRPFLESESAPTDLAAARSGLVRRVSILSGLALVQEGEAATEGQTLARCIPGEGRARGSVLAETIREISAVCPKTETAKKRGGPAWSRFAVCFGKRRVNLYFSSGKAIDGCDKIVSVYTLGKKGLFALPVRIVRETLVRSRYGEQPAESARMAERLMERLQSGLEGQILEHSFAAFEKDGLMVVTLRAHCLENIARAREGEA